MRFAWSQTPKHVRKGVYREFFGRSVVRYEVEPSGDVPFDIDVTLQMLPGLVMATGRMHGSRDRRTRNWIADVSCFNRIFRRLYGDTPTAVRVQTAYQA